MMNRLRERLARFMVGRYVIDQLGQFLCMVVIVLVVLGFFAGHGRVSRFLWSLEILAFVVLYYRMLSKNYARRYQENEAYLRLRERFLGRFRGGRGGFNGQRGGGFGAAGNGNPFAGFGERMRERREHRIFKCPNCGQRVRVPRGRGKISIHCPKCGRDFIKRT